MWIDADDIIKDNEIEKINYLKNHSTEKPSMFLMKYLVAFENNIPTFQFYRERIIKKSANLKWSGFVHEAIPITQDAIYLDISIEHHKIKNRDKKRNLKIYRNAKRKGIEFTPRETYYYARELYYNSYYKKALSELKKFIKLKNIYPPNKLEATILISNIYTQFKDYKNAKKYLFEYLKFNSPTPELCCSIGNIFNLENSYNVAIFWYKSALNTENLKGGFFEPDYSFFIPHLELSIMYYYLGDIEKGKYHHNIAKNLKPNNPTIMHNDEFFTNN
jgi:tetratricopeptide (TPR) repeat protein